MNILLLGNGFDLYHLFPTKYVNFLNTVSFLASGRQYDINTVGDVFGRTELHKMDWGIAASYQKYTDTYNSVQIDPTAIQQLIALGKKNIWFSFLQKSFNKDLGWIDFEQEIAVVLKSFEELLQKTDIKINFKSRLSTVEARYLVKFFSFYLNPSKSDDSWTGALSVKDGYTIEYPLGSNNKIINKEKIVSELARALEELAEALKLYLRYFVDNVVTALKTAGKIELCAALKYTDYTVSFNYTNTYEILYAGNQVFHLHGNVNDKIILGINPDSSDEVGSIDTSFIRFKKYYQRVLYETDMDYLQWLTNIQKLGEERNLLIMGHSLDVTDRDILYELIECASKITILYHDENAKSQYIANLVKIFGREQFIQLRATKSLTFLPLTTDFTTFVQERAEDKVFKEFFDAYEGEEIVIV